MNQKSGEGRLHGRRLFLPLKYKFISALECIVHMTVTQDAVRESFGGILLCYGGGRRAVGGRNEGVDGDRASSCAYILLGVADFEDDGVDEDVTYHLQHPYLDEFVYAPLGISMWRMGQCPIFVGKRQGGHEWCVHMPGGL